MAQLKNSINPMMYDLAFMYSLKCNLRCSFCMYDCSPEINWHLDMGRLETWLKSVDINKISSFGVYGGEPSILRIEYGKILDLVTDFNKPQFIITNGSWSTSISQTMLFLQFCAKYRLHIVVSGTAEHRQFQHREILEELKKMQPEAVTLKPLDEHIHAMGRANVPFSCSHKCIWWNKSLRIAVFPTGDILFQNCDGEYPTVGNIDEDFRVIDSRIQDVRRNGFAILCKHWKG